MTTTIDSTGITVDDFDSALTYVQAKLKSEFGDSISLTDDSVFGKIAKVLAEIKADHAEQIRYATEIFDPQKAGGTWLSDLVMLNGIERRAAEYSTVSLTCTALASGCTIPAGSIVSDPTNSTIEFATDETLVLGSSASGTVSATATVAGAIMATAGTLTKINNPVYGWGSVTNAASASVGRVIESDTVLRARRKWASKQIGRHSTPKLYTALANISEVSSAVVHENNTNKTDAYGQPPHSVWCIVNGGADETIAQAVYDNKAGGIAMHGSTNVVFAHPTLGYDVTATFDRPTEKTVEIYIKNRITASYPTDGDDLIKQAIVDYFNGDFVLDDGETNNGFGISENVEYFRLLTPINSIGGHAVTYFRIRWEGGSYNTIDLETGRTEIAVITTDDITIERV